MIEDAVANLGGQVEARAVALQHVDHAQRLEVMVKLHAVGAQRAVESLFAGVSEGSVAEVVPKRDRLHQILVET